MGVRHLLVLLLLTFGTAFVGRADGSLAPALFILGDSTVDTGNQNYITSIIKSDYPPYGKDFVPPGPTGRFSNGKLANDFMADYLGLPYPVNFLSPSATGSVLLTGVNFASSGSGFLDGTGTIVGVRNFSRQLDDLGTVQASIVQQIGQPATVELFKNSIFLVSTGSNDFAISYNLNPVMQKSYTPAQYQQLVLDKVSDSLKTLYNYGVRKLVIDSLPPVGCAPEQLNMYNSKDGVCLESVNAPLRNFNEVLVPMLAGLRYEYPDYQILYVDIYTFLLDYFVNPTNHGFMYGNMACCGEGAYKGLPCVNPISDICDDVNDYVFWDLFHPSQKAYQELANAIIYGDPSQITPNNLQQIV